MHKGFNFDKYLPTMIIFTGTLFGLWVIAFIYTLIIS